MKARNANFWKGKSAKFNGKLQFFGEILVWSPVWTAQKANMKGNQAQKAKMKEMKPQKAKMKGNEAPKGQNEKKWSPKKLKWKGIKGQNEGPKPRIFEKEKLQNLKGKLQF